MNDLKTVKLESLNQQATFSSDDEEVYETNSSKQLAPIVPIKTPTPTAALSTIAVANQTTLTLSSLQAQLQQHIQRPNKLFTTIEDTLANSNTQLDNHLNLIGSDELRDKLAELNSHLKVYYQVSFISI